MTRTQGWIVFFAGLLALALRVQSATMSPEARAMVREQQTYQTLRKTIAERYVGEVDEKKLFFGALKGMAGALDRHTIFWTPEQFDLEKTETSGHFAGIGIEIRFEEERGLTIVTPIAGTPAFKAGLMPHDLIRKIDGESVEKMDQEDASKRIRGAPGTEVKLTVERVGVKTPLEFTIMRAVIKVQSIPEAYMLKASVAAAARIPLDAPRIGYVQMSGFQEDTAADLEAALSKLEGEGLQALVLDLRQNRGGLLTSAVKVCDLFLSDLTIVTTRSRGEKGGTPEEEIFRATKKDSPRRYPVAVLIDGTSASASEIVAGCLHDHGRAQLVGQKSYGKGSVQTIIPVGMGAFGEGAVKVTTAKYYTPNDVCIDGTGIAPDYLVEFNLDQLRGMLYERRRRHLALNDPRGNGELPVPEPMPETPAKPNDARGSEPVDPEEDVEPAKPHEPFYDLQLEKAVEVLAKQLKMTNTPKP